MSIELEKAYNKAKIGILTKGSVFLTTITFSLKHSWSTEVSTAGTDGIRLLINEQFFMSLTEPERVSLLYHESWHVALNHILRKGTRDHVRYNKAGDYVINGMAIADGFTIPHGWLYDPQYNGMSTNQVYDLLPVEPGNTGAAGYDCDILKPSKPEEVAEIEVAVQSTLVRAMSASKMAGEQPGKIPDEILRELDKILNPVLPWDLLLHNYLTARAKDDYTWARPNKRYMPEYYLPTQYSEALGHIVIAIDTSGSISQSDLTKILSEIKHIHDKFAPEKLTILDCDTKIHNVYEVTPDMDILELNFQGGGGTNFKPVIEFCKDLKLEALLYFTDLFAAPITVDPGYPILWLCYSSHAPAPIGNTVYYKA